MCEKLAGALASSWRARLLGRDRTPRVPASFGRAPAALPAAREKGEADALWWEGRGVSVGFCPLPGRAARFSALEQAAGLRLTAVPMSPRGRQRSA